MRSASCPSCWTGYYRTKSLFASSSPVPFPPQPTSLAIAPANQSRSRLPSLYSDLSLQRQTNPDGYSANIQAWQIALSHAALAGHLPCSASSPSVLTLQTSEQLLSALSSRQYGRPLGLGAVIDESVRTGKMIPRSEFLVSKKSIYARSWVPSPWSLLSWGLKTIGLLGEESWDINGRLRVGELIVVENVERLGRKRNR